MNINETRYRLVPKDFTRFEPTWGDDLPLSFAEFCETSVEENMCKLTEDTIRAHAYGMATISEFFNPKGVVITDILSYAGVTGFENINGNKLAIVGGVLTIPSERRKGYSLATTRALCEVASDSEALSKHKHNGLMARCNVVGQKLFEKLDFDVAGEKLGKILMVKMF